MIKRIAIAVAGLLALGVAGVAVYIATFDIDAWRPRIIAEAERATGRTVTIGALEMRGLITPTIALSNATLGNLAGGSRAAMLHVARAEMQVSLLALISGRIEVRHLILESPNVLLEVVNGTPNWAFPAGPATGAAPDVAIGRLSIRHARLAFPGGPAGGVELIRLDAEGDDELRGNAELRWDDTLLRITTRGAPLARMMAGATGTLPLSARIEMEGARLSLDGTLRGLQDYVLDAVGQADQAALRRIATLLGRTGPLPERVAITARIAGNGWGWPREQAVRFEMGAVEIAPGVALQSTLVESASADAPLRVTLAGTRLGDAFTLEGGIGPWRPAQPVPLDLTGTLLGHRLRVAGAVAEPQAGRGIAVDATLESPVLGQVRARVAERGAFFADGVELSAIRAEGATTQDGDLLLSAAGISGRVALGRVDLDALPAAPSAAPAPPARRDARIIPDTRIELGPLTAMPLDLALTIATLRQGGQDFRDITARINVADGRLRLDPLGVTLPAGRITLRVAAQPGPTATQIQIGLRADALDMAQLLPNPPISGRAELDIDLRGQGATWRAVAANAVGHAGLAVLNGHVNAALVQGALPAGLAPRIDVACLAMRFDVVAGIAQARTLYADTSLGRVSGGGQINLRDESLALRLGTDLRLPPAIRIRAPVPISGTVGAPRIDNAALIAGGVAGTALGTATGLVPGLNQALGVQGMPDCGPPLSVARGGRAGPVPRSLMPAESAPVQNLMRGLGIR